MEQELARLKEERAKFREKQPKPQGGQQSDGPSGDKEPDAYPVEVYVKQRDLLGKGG